MYICCARAPRCPNLPWVGRRTDRNTANMTWRGTMQSDMTRGDEGNTYGFPSIPPHPPPPAYLHAYYIPALAVTDRKAQRYLRSCICQHHQWCTWNVVSMQWLVPTIRMHHTPLPLVLAALPGTSETSPQSPHAFPKDLGQERRESSSWHLFH